MCDLELSPIKLLPATCSDHYIKMRMERMHLIGLPQNEIDRFRAHLQELKSRHNPD